MASTEPPASYLDAHRYDGAVIQHDRRDRISPCPIQPRDLRLIADVRGHKFLTAPQLRELWWPGRSVQAADRRLLKLFQAGHLERFRPLARRGSFPWTYHLGHGGHRLLQDAGLLDLRVRYRQRAIYDYSLVLHELQLNSWALACRRLLGERLLRWEGETDIEPPREARQGQARLGDYWTVKGLRTPEPRLLRPDTVLAVGTYGERTGEATTVLVEFDRTRRLDKNFDKFRRYDSFLNAWWQHTNFGNHQHPPCLLFVCQDSEHREQFLEGADRQLTGHHWHASVNPDGHRYLGRRHILFAVEADAHRGRLEGWQLPAFPPGHPCRNNKVREVSLGGAPEARPAPEQLRVPSAAEPD